MTEKPKIRLFSSPVFVLAVFILPLAALFFSSITFHLSFFIPLIFSLLVIIAYLIPLQSRIAQKKNEIELKTQDLKERNNLLEAQIKDEEQFINAYQKKIVGYSQLKNLTERLSHCLYLEETSQVLSDQTNKLLGDSETTTILYLFHSKTGDLGITASQKGLMRINLKSKKGDEFDQWVIKAMQPLLVENTKNDYRFDMDKIDPHESRTIRSLISAPLLIGNKALGILRMDSNRENRFNTEDLRFLTTIGDLGTVAVENAYLFEQTEQLAIRDSLTKLYLRRYLMERLGEEIHRQMRRKGELSFLMIDLDKFKKYNDEHGHTAGDIVLKTLGTLLEEFFAQPGNVTARYGGEEFCVLLPDCSKAKAIALAEEFRKRVEAYTIFLRREKSFMTVSIGVSSFPKDAQIKEELIHKADAALYEAKDKGRNQVVAA